MSNGYLVVSEADREAAYTLGDGFDLDVIGAATLGDSDATATALTGAANVGLVLSNAAAGDAAFVALLHALAQRVGVAQLIVVEPEARAAFAFLPEAWPIMPIAVALERAGELTRRRQAGAGANEPPHAAPLPPTPPPVEAEETAPSEPNEHATPAPESAEETPPILDEVTQAPADEAPPAPEAEQQFQTDAPPAQELERSAPTIEDVTPAPSDDTAREELPPLGGVEDRDEQSTEEVIEDGFGAGTMVGAPAPAHAEPPAPPTIEETPTSEALPEAPPPSMPAPQAPEESDLERAARAPARARKSQTASIFTDPTAGSSAPADATAFAPKKLRRGTPELARIVIHQPTDLAAVIKAARRIDPRAAPAPHSIGIGSVALGARVGVSLEVRGAACDGTPQRRVWEGEPIDFSFSIEADADVKQIVVLARVFVNDAQIGVLAFTRPVIGAEKKPQGFGDKVRLKRHKRVFLSYSSKDRETVSAIATAYASAGVEHFWDRTSLKSGEEWSPRLRREIERADLFHLCWSKSAAASEWVEKEASYALTRRRRAKKPEITVQMLDGPPWAKHPDSLDSINFDDFVRAAIVGYARGEGET